MIHLFTAITGESTLATVFDFILSVLNVFQIIILAFIGNRMQRKHYEDKLRWANNQIQLKRIRDEVNYGPSADVDDKPMP